MANDEIALVRNRLQTIVERADGTTSTRDIVMAFRESDADIVRGAIEDLVTIALTKLVNEVGQRRHKMARVGQGDLFLGHSVPGTIMVLVKVGKKTTLRRKPPMQTTLREAEAYLKRQPERKKVTRDAGLEAVVNRVRPYMNKLMTLKEGVAALEAAEKAAQREVV